MPHLEEQFPPVNPLVLQRPDALQPPEPEEDEQTGRTENRDEAPRPGTLADGIDRVTLSRSARAIAPVEPTAETIPAPTERASNAEEETPAINEITSADLQDFVNGVEENRVSNEAVPRVESDPSEQPTSPIFAPAAPLVPNAEREPRIDNTLRIVTRNAIEPVADGGRNENPTPRNDRLTPPAPPTRSLLSDELRTGNTRQPDVPLENPLGLRGNTPEPLDREVNILVPANVGEDPPVPNIQEARNFGLGRTLTLSPDTAQDERNVIAQNTVEEVLEEDGAIPVPGGPEPRAEIIPPSTSAVSLEINEAPVTEPENDDFVPAIPDPRNFNTERQPVTERNPEAIEPRPAIERDPAASEGETSFLINTNEVLESSRAFQEVQPPAFPELDPDEPFISIPELEVREEDVPIVAQQTPLNIPPPEFENVVPVAPPLPGNVETLDENPQALRRDNLGTDPALRSNRAIRNFLQEFNNRIETPEAVTEPEGGPIAEVQNNAPPPPAVFENLETVRTELLNDLRKQEEGVTRPEEQNNAPPEPRTSDTLLTERGQNIDQFI